MRSYSEAPYSSMDVRDDGELEKTLITLFQSNPPKYFIETGTYLGTGSTAIFARAIEKSGIKPAAFYTIEANKNHWVQAKENLKPYPFITPVFGRTITVIEAKEFLANDYAFNHQDEFPDIYIDPNTNYLEETEGNGSSKDPDWAGEWLLDVYLNNLSPFGLCFISLDSAGGIGLLEFNKVIRIMGDRHYYLFLDDIFHCKHFRSYKYILERPKQFKVLLQKTGWALIEAGHPRGEG